MLEQRTVICTTTDPTFAAALTAATQSHSGRLLWAADLAEWIDGVDRLFPMVALIDIDRFASDQLASNMGNGGPLVAAESASSIPPTQSRPTETWETALRRIKLRPHTKYIPLVGFSRHDHSALTIAQENGIDETWLLATLQHQLPAVVQRYLDPPTRYIDGWDETLPPLALQGIDKFNRGDYFEQHELLEEAWRAETGPIRELYQGILQVGVAFYQVELGNWAGAVKTFRRALPKLRGLPPICQGIDLAPFLTVVERIHLDVTALGPERLSTFERSQFPQIVVTSSSR